MGCCSTSATRNETVNKPSAIELEFLFLDESICKPCGGTRQALAEAVEVVAAPLAALGVALEIKKIHVASREDAIMHQLVTSPTIRINGVDIDPDQTQSECGSCGEIAGGQTTVNCRTWHWKGEVYSSAPSEKIVEAILKTATPCDQSLSGCCEETGKQAAYSLPNNLDGFFLARDNDEQICC